MKARNSLAARCREKRVNQNKKQKMVKVFSKALGNRFQLTSKLISSAKNKKIDYRGPSIKWTL